MNEALVCINHGLFKKFINKWIKFDALHIRVVTSGLGKD